MLFISGVKKILFSISSLFLTASLLFISLTSSAKIERSLAVKFVNGARLALENDRLYFTLPSGEKVPLRGENLRIVAPNQSATKAAIVEHVDRRSNEVKNRFLIFQDGSIAPVPVKFTGAEQWTYSQKDNTGHLYGVISIKYIEPLKSAVMLVRASDGHRLTLQTETYLDQSSASQVFDPKQLGWDLDRFEANDGFSNFLSEAKHDFFVGIRKGKFRRIATSPNSATQSESSLGQVVSGFVSKIQIGLDMLASEFDSNSELEDKLNNRVFGQSHLVKSLVRNSHVIDDESSTRPRIVMITGTSGAGKSYVARELARERLQDMDYFLEIDGTKYAGGDAQQANIMAHKLFGAEKAWQGEQTGELTEFLRKTKGRGVVVINEAEKMNPYIYTRLMEYFDTGMVTAGDGEEIAGKQVLVVLTSNRGARQLIPEGAKDWSDADLERYVQGVTSDDVKRVFTTKQKANDNVLPEEVINRIDEFLLSSPLTKPVLNKIFRAAVIRENEALAQKYKGLQFNFTDAAQNYLALVNVDLMSHGRLMNRRAEGVFKDLKETIAKAISSKKWRSDQITEINIDLKEDATHKWYFVVNNDLFVAVPQPSNPNPLADPYIRKIIGELDSSLKRRVIGQDAMIDNVHELIVDHLAQGVRYLPTVFMTVGTTGTGKTETGLAIAESVFGSTTRAGVIDLGEVSSAYQFALKFEQGLEGAESEFERYLRNNPDGGVLILDEASNMGGQNRAMKNELFKKFYAIFDRGNWVSSVTGKTYDLTKHIIQLTGNDGEHFFAGSSADEDRLEIWKSKNREEFIHEMLIESGVPEALIGRLATVILTKPLLRSDLKPIAEKILKEKIRPLETQYRGLKISYGPEVLNSLAESFFTHGRGVRSIRTVVEKRFGSAIQMALFKSGMDLNNLDGVNLELKIEDNKSQAPYRNKNAEERKVHVVVAITKKEGSNITPIFSRKVDLTEFAQEQVLMKYDEAWLTAIHEAGHAVANVPDITGEKVAYITIRGGTSGTGSQKIRYLGYARTRLVDGYVSPDHAKVVGQIARIAAGNVAEVMSGNAMTGGWSDDLLKIRRLAKAALINYGFDPRFHGIQIDGDGNPILSEAKRRQLESAKSDLIEQGMELARQTLSDNWSYVISVATELMQKGEIDGTRFAELGKFMKPESMTSVKKPSDKTATSVSPTMKQLMCRGFYSLK